jgi:protein-tyrosine-phosphatase
MPEAGEPKAPRPEGRTLRILTVCTHNRTRSVMMAAMLESMLVERLGLGAVVTKSAGFGPPGVAAIADAVEAMRRRGLDVSGHRSQHVTPILLDEADVVLTAERDHVVKIAALSPSAFPISTTLPEFLQLAVANPSRSPEGFSEWVRGLTSDRTASRYLRADVDEIADPTGSPPRIFETAVAALEQNCSEAAGYLALPFT